MRKYTRQGLTLALLTITLAATAGAATLKGSRTSMRKQHKAASAERYTFLSTPSQLRTFVNKGLLESVTSNADFTLNRVSFPYARPEAHLFLKRLAMQYHAATGQRLIVTSLTRPKSEQPNNAHPLSVHPAGIAIDLRIPQTSASRKWLERTLLSLEDKKVLDVTRERNPAHYHIAVFPAAYKAYANKQTARARQHAMVFVGPITLA
jgi:hypothetical protein